MEMNPKIPDHIETRFLLYTGQDTAPLRKTIR